MSRTLLSRLTIVLVGLALGAGCNVPLEDLSALPPAAGGKADGEETTAPQLPPWLWHRLDYGQLVSHVVGTPPARAAEDPLAARVRYWGEALHRVTAELKPEYVANVPAPVVLVSDGGYDNAFSAGADFRYTVPVMMPDNAGTSGLLPGLSYLPSGVESLPFRVLRPVTTCDGPQMPCFATEADLDAVVRERVPEFVAWLNTIPRPAFGPTCTFVTAADQQGMVLTQAACGPTKAYDEYGGAESFVIGGQTDNILIGSVMVERATTEPMLVAIIAHEFVHLMKAHTSQLSLKSRGGYHYDDTNDATRTTEPPASADGAGFYTFEQEADELIPELLASLGFDAAPAVEMYLVALRAMTEEGHLSPDVDPYAECVAMRDAGWQRKPQLGSFRIPHHSPCYRIWNIDNANAARRPVINQDLTHPAVDWAALREGYLSSLGAPPNTLLPSGPSCPAGAICDGDASYED